MKTLELNGKTVGVVDNMPNNLSNEFWLSNNGSTLISELKDGTSHFTDLGSDDWQFLSLHSEMDEGKASILGLDLESYHSLIRSIGYVTENPYGEKEQFDIFNASDLTWSERLKNWQEAQKQVVKLAILIKEG